LFPMSHDSPESTLELPHKRGLIHRVLEPALQLWLKSQVESISGLAVHLEGGDRQILSGYLPLVQINAQNVVYQGLYLSQIELSGHNFKINIGQILKGKPLRLLEPISINLNVRLDAADAQASLHSALLQAAIVDALQLLVGEQISDAIGPDISPEALTLHDPNLLLSEHNLRFSAELNTRDGSKSVPVALQTALSLDNPHTLTLDRPEWLPTRNAKRGLPLHDLHGYTFDLGPQVQIQSLQIDTETISIQGQMTVLPEA
jgi:LmeA-like phospholipid-binding